LIDKSGPVRVIPVRVLLPRHFPLCQGFSVGSIDLSGLGCSSLMIPPSTGGLEPEEFLGSPLLNIAQLQIPTAVNGQGVYRVELTRALAFGKSPEPLDPTIRHEDHDELVFGRYTHDQLEDTQLGPVHR
jgi:hypothetical protein